MSSFVCRLCHQPICEPPPIVGERPTERYIRIGQFLAVHLQNQHRERVETMLAGMMQFQTLQLYTQFTCPAEVSAEMNRVAEHLRNEWFVDASEQPSPIVKP